jgi:hypothetical protein
MPVGRASRRGPPRGARRGDRQRDAKAGAASLARLARDAAAVRLYDLAADRETQARSFSLRRKEWIEDSRANLAWNSPPSIVHVDGYAHTVGQHADVDGAAVRHGLSRVANKVHESLSDLGFIEKGGRQIIVDAEGDGAVGALELGASKLDDREDGTGDVLGLHAGRGEAGDAEILLGEHSEPLHFSSDGGEKGEAFASRALLLELFLEELDVEPDGRERVSDLVRYVCRHLADCRESLVRHGPALRARDRADHSLERCRQVSDLVFGRDDLARRQVPPRHGPGSFGDSAERRQELANVQRHRHPHPEGRERQDDERVDCPYLTSMGRRRELVDRALHPV